MSLLNYKRIKSLPDGVKKKIVEDVVSRIIERQERDTTVKPSSVEENPKDPVDTLEKDHQTNIPEELKNPKEHGGETEVLVSRLRESREE